RAEALAVFFAIAQIVGAVGPAFYGALIGGGTDRAGLTIGYLVGGGIMIIGGLVELVWGINAEGKSLEDIALPLTAVGSRRPGSDNRGRSTGPVPVPGRLSSRSSSSCLALSMSISASCSSACSIKAERS